MADHAVPHMHNDLGVERIRIGAREFKCMGATPPHDHPHIYVDMGEETHAICPYCSTVYMYDPALKPDESDPPGCVAKAEDTARRTAPGRLRESAL